MKNQEGEAVRWFLQAEDDFRFVEWLRQEGTFFDKGCFVAQQAAEKALKACLYAAGERHVLTHSSYEIAERLSRREGAFLSILDEAKRLDRYYIPTRYPNGLPGGVPFQVYSASDLQEACQDLRRVMEVSRKFLEGKGILSSSHSREQ